MDDFLTLVPEEILEETIEHHGIKGQKWGVRNAEWYPIDAYNKAKGIVVDAANSKTAKRIASGAEEAAKATKSAAKKAVEVSKNSYAKHKEKSEEKKEAKQQRKAEVSERKQQERKAASEAEKKRILNQGTPREVLAIANELTNEELRYAKDRNELLKNLRNLDSTYVKNVKEKQVRKKWGKIMDLGDTVKMLSEPLGDAATAIERFNKLKKAMEGSDGSSDNKDKDKKKDKKDKNKDDKTNISGMPSLFGPSEERSQNRLYKDVVKTAKSVKDSGFNAFDRVMRVNKISEMDSVKNVADDNLLSLQAKYLKNQTQSSYDTYANEVVKRSQALLGKKYDDNYGGLLAQGIDGAVSKKLGYGEYNTAKNKVNTLKKQLDRGKTDYDIPIKKNSAYDEYTQAKKDLASAKKNYENNINKYSSMNFKNDSATREAMRIAKSDGWDALTSHQKDLLNDAN